MKNCSQCGLCCKLFLINLNKKECESGKYKTQFQRFGVIKSFQKAEKIGANILKQKKDNSCIYLKRNKCSIHEIRPQACRDFFCSSKSKKFKRMIEKINKKRALRLH